LNEGMTLNRISVIGTGDMGGAIAEALAKRTQHEVVVRGSRPGSPSAAALIERFDLREATEGDIELSDVVFVVVPADAISDVVALLDKYEGIIVSVSVSGSVGQDAEISTAERLARALPSARIVNAFTSVWSTVIRNPGTLEKTSVFVCADDRDAKAVIMNLAEELGFDSINGGPLSVALYAEALGVFAVHLARDSGYGQTISFRAFRANG